jgi:hypothetical protein
MVPLYRSSDTVDGPASEQIQRNSAQGETPDVWAMFVDEDAGRLRAGDIAFVRPSVPPPLGDTVAALRNRKVVAMGDLVERHGPRATIRAGKGGEAETLEAVIIVKIVALQIGWQYERKYPS